MTDLRGYVVDILTESRRKEDEYRREHLASMRRVEELCGKAIDSYASTEGAALNQIVGWFFKGRALGLAKEEHIEALLAKAQPEQKSELLLGLAYARAELDTRFERATADLMQRGIYTSWSDAAGSLRKALAEADISRQEAGFDEE